MSIQSQPIEINFTSICIELTGSLFVNYFAQFKSPFKCIINMRLNDSRNDPLAFEKFIKPWLH